MATNGLKNGLVPMNATINPVLRGLVSPHVDSFDWFLEHGLSSAAEEIGKVLITAPEFHKDGITCWLTDVHVEMPKKRKFFPREARERATTYGGQLKATLVMRENEISYKVNVDLGLIPIMVGSKLCSVRDMSPANLVRHREEANEVGGYFIVNGNEKLIRMLVAQRRNTVFVIDRPSFAKFGTGATSLGAMLRSVTPGGMGSMLSVHYFSDGTLSVRLFVRRSDFFLPIVVLLRALVNLTDAEIFQRVLQGEKSPFMTDRVELCLELARAQELYDQDRCIRYLGNHFAPYYQTRTTEPRQAVRLLLKEAVFPHLGENFATKAQLLVLMVRKLYSVAAGIHQVDSLDVVPAHEVYLPGELYTRVIHEGLRKFIYTFRRRVQLAAKTFSCGSSKEVKKVIARSSVNVGQVAHYFLSTGNHGSQLSSDLLQSTGFVVMAEKINFLRFMAHFRGIHRGAYFQESKITKVRKLLPSAWGFICPVHTPDGAPCGLLNHLAANVKVSGVSKGGTQDCARNLLMMGVQPSDSLASLEGYIVVCVDGVVVGHVPQHMARRVARQMRGLKGTSIPEGTEVVLIMDSAVYPGLYLYTSMGRLLRPVQDLLTNKIEMIGSFEQIFMSIAVKPDEVIPNVSTHMETSPQGILSMVASLTPFSDHNQSPRNMYQCQMGKQTMGTPSHSLRFRSDNKMYVIHTPQTPITRTEGQEKFGIDEFPTGTNCVVAVLSMTGYDMEDAMIINKAAFERGFHDGSVYKVLIVNLNDEKGGEVGDKRFTTDPMGGLDVEHLEADGLPSPGTQLYPGSVLYSYYDKQELRYRTVKYKGGLTVTVEAVRVTSSGLLPGIAGTAHIHIREPRAPVIGDKFSSRHGQKGTLSQLWPQENMPWTESGITPDIIINPNAFPSRMTIGMLIESIAGKAGAMRGEFMDATPFAYGVDGADRAVDYFGRRLLETGFNYFGNEPMYSGMSGVECEAQLFVGIVFYQRLRHMVSDKFQVRHSEGPIDKMTHQPVKGRKRGGGVRCGEMERDSLLSHGAAHVVNDRLFRSSDYSVAQICSVCGDLVSVRETHQQLEAVVKCIKCDNNLNVVDIAMPYAFQYLSAELAAMNIKVKFAVKQK